MFEQRCGLRMEPGSTWTCPPNILNAKMIIATGTKSVSPENPVAVAIVVCVLCDVFECCVCHNCSTSSRDGHLVDSSPPANVNLNENVKTTISDFENGIWSIMKQ